MSDGARDYDIIGSQAEVHKHKSEYLEAHNIQNQLLQASPTHNSYHLGFTSINVAEIEVLMGVPKNLIQEKIDAAYTIAKGGQNKMLMIACDLIQADFNLREGDMSSFLFRQCLSVGWGKSSEAVTYCLERLGDSSRWEESHHLSSWATVFLAHSSKGKQKLEIHKALQFLGDLFLRENDEVTAVSLFTLALEGFTQMDIHRSRAECMIRLGDISSKNEDLLRALELWETARLLFERSSQTKRVQDVDERLVKIAEDVKEQYKRDLARLAELKAPRGKVEEVGEDLSEDELGKEAAGLVAA
ncbi:hypothetical protein B0H16DRAFT_1723630 [Mycena metata]|uniref:Uncharacterized protein n=1 Tax=Mycena metata TaxID=1033252 RepID=A0AAD7IX40_9AGAR|nr:hypothetical protein B0H16DRAFT_1723630 [Mycena metata]